MWNPFNYIKSPSSQQVASDHSLHSQKNIQPFHQQKNKKINQQFLITQYTQFHKKILNFQQLINKKSLNQQQNQKLKKSFSLIIEQLQKCLNILQQIKINYTINKEKLQQFDQIKKKLQNHTLIVNSIQEEKQREVRKLLEEKNKIEEVWDIKMESMRKEIERYWTENQGLKNDVKVLKQNNERLNQKINQLSLYNTNLSKQNYKLQDKLILITDSYKNQSYFKTLPQPLIDPQNIKLQNLLYSSKYRNKLCEFLQKKDLLNLILTKKSIHSLIIKIIPQFLHFQYSQKINKQIQKIKNQSIYYKNLLYDGFQNQNIKINAIKYLFFKQKPGGYILSMFQEDFMNLNEEQNAKKNQEGRQSIIQKHKEINNVNSNVKQKQKEKNRKISWREYFKYDKNKKDQNIHEDLSNISTNSHHKIPQIKKFSLAQLKSSQTFKNIQSYISKTFHIHIFSIQLPKDLQQFSKIMQQQFNQMKIQLKKFNQNSQNITIKIWTSKLLTFSKFLYLQSQQIWSLCNIIFTKLIQMQKIISKQKSQIQDLNENNNGMRKLTQQLAKNKIQMEKRIWESQRKISMINSQKNSLQLKFIQKQKNLKKSQNLLKQNEQKIYNLEKQLQNKQEKLKNVIKKYKQKQKEILFLKDQVLKISWI